MVDMVMVSAFPKCWVEDITERKMELEEWIRLSVTLQVDGLEMYTGFFRSFDDKYIKHIRTCVEEKGMVIPMLCHSSDFTIDDNQLLRYEIEKQKQMIELSSKLGARYCRVLSGQKRPGINVEKGIKQVVDCIMQCIPTAEEYGVCLVMENHYKDSYWEYPEFAQKQDIFIKIVSQIDSKNFGVQFDPSNSIVAGEDPVELLKQVSHRVYTMHASDRYLEEGYDLRSIMSAIHSNGYHPALKHGVIGCGLNDYDTIFSLLAKVGFNGWISIEDGVNGMDEMKRSIDFVKVMIKKYF